MVLLALSLAAAIIKLSGSERIVVVPPVINKSFWIESEKMSAEYLEQMAYYLAQLTLSVTPANARFQLDLLLKHTSPTFYQAMKQANERFLKKVAQESVVTFFTVQKIDTNADQKAVVMTGVQTTFLNGSKLADQPKKFLMQFQYENGRITLSNFKEMSVGGEAKEILENVSKSIKIESEANEKSKQDTLLPLPN